MKKTIYDPQELQNCKCVEEAIKFLEEAAEQIVDFDEENCERIDIIIRRLKTKYFYEDM